MRRSTMLAKQVEAVIADMDKATPKEAFEVLTGAQSLLTDALATYRARPEPTQEAEPAE